MVKNKLNPKWAEAAGDFPLDEPRNSPDLAEIAKMVSPGYLSQFTGTAKLYQVALFGRTVCTDGVKHVADTAGAWWLLDIIVTYQFNAKIKQEKFQVWKLTVWEDHSATLECEDGNGNLIISHEIETTDFPVPELTVWYVWERGGLPTILLPSEY